jgi:hypothetical protein
MPDDNNSGQVREDGVPPLAVCSSHHPGHTVHWIQALHTANKPQAARRTWPGTIRGIDGEVVTIARGRRLHRYRNHDPERLAAVVAGVGRRVSLNDQYSIMRVGSYCFSVARDRGVPLEPCGAAVPGENADVRP